MSHHWKAIYCFCSNGSLADDVFCLPTSNLLVGTAFFSVVQVLNGRVERTPIQISVCLANKIILGTAIQLFYGRCELWVKTHQENCCLSGALKMPAEQLKENKLKLLQETGRRPRMIYFILFIRTSAIILCKFSGWMGVGLRLTIQHRCIVS